MHLLVWTASSIAQYFDWKYGGLFCNTVCRSTSCASNMGTVAIVVKSSGWNTVKASITIHSQFRTSSKVYMWDANSTVYIYIYI